jgi:hypothetical protein
VPQHWFRAAIYIEYPWKDGCVMDTPEDPLALARRLLDEVRRLVEGQRIIVHRRQLAGLDTALSEDVLRTFELSLARFEAELAPQSLH